MRSDRKLSISNQLLALGVQHNFVEAIEPKDLGTFAENYLRITAECVWQSHRKCLELASKSSTPSVILEDDAILQFSADDLKDFIREMNKKKFDFLQLGFLQLNFSDTISILIRNFYDLVVKKQVAPKIFRKLGFKEVARSEGQTWRKEVPRGFIVNDIRYGAHCYVVSPEFSKKMLKLNSPAFLSTDDFYVALGKMKSFRMIRLSRSVSSQDDSRSSFEKRYLLD